MKTLLITPPLLQPNTPYAATPLLTAWLRKNGHDAVQADLSIEFLLKLLSDSGIDALCRALENSPAAADAATFLASEAHYRDVVDEVILFLQDRSPTSAKRLAKRGTLPEGAHITRAYQQNEDFGWSFRGLDKHDRARHLCSLFLDDITAAATRLDPLFEFSRYGETLSSALTEFRTLQ